MVSKNQRKQILNKTHIDREAQLSHVLHAASFL